MIHLSNGINVAQSCYISDTHKLLNPLHEKEGINNVDEVIRQCLRETLTAVQVDQIAGYTRSLFSYETFITRAQKYFHSNNRYPSPSYTGHWASSAELTTMEFFQKPLLMLNFGRKLKVLPIEELKFNSQGAAGYPLNGSKGELWPEMCQLYRDFRARFPDASKIPGNEMDKLLLKLFPRMGKLKSINKVTARAIFADDAISFLNGSRYVQAFVPFLKRYVDETRPVACPTSYGGNQADIAHIIEFYQPTVIHGGEFDEIYPACRIDTSAADTAVLECEKLQYLDGIQSIFDMTDPETKWVFDFERRQIERIQVCHTHRSLVRVPDIFPSGKSYTSIGMSWICYRRAILLSKTLEFNQLRLCVLGDDIVMKTYDTKILELTASRATQILQNYIPGVKITDCEMYINIGDTTFLGHRVRNGKLSRDTIEVYRLLMYPEFPVPALDEYSNGILAATRVEGMFLSLQGTCPYLAQLHGYILDKFHISVKDYYSFNLRDETISKELRFFEI